MRPALFALALAFAFLAALPFVHADSSLETSGFYFASNDTLIETTNFTFGKHPYYLIRGASGRVLILDANETPVEDSVLLDRLTNAYAGVSTSLNYPLSLSVQGQIAQLQSQTGACQTAYDDFLHGRTGVCYEERFFKYQCSLLYDQGLWQDILDFDIVAARKNIESGLAGLGSNLTVAQNESQFLSSLLSANASSSRVLESRRRLNASLSLVGVSLSQFNSGHTLMISYGPFARDGKLSRCVLNTTAYALASNAVRSGAVNSTSLSLQIRAGLPRALDAGLPKGLAIRANHLLDSYDALYANFSDQFTTINGVRPYFASSYDQYLQFDIKPIQQSANADDARAHFSDFTSAYDEALSRIANARTIMPAYKNAADNLSALSDWVQNASSRGIARPHIDSINGQYTSLSYTFSLEEVDLSSNGTGRVPVFSDIATNSSRLLKTARAFTPSGPLETIWIWFSAIATSPIGIATGVILIVGPILYVVFSRRLKKFVQKQGRGEV